MPGLSGADVANKLLAKRPDQPILFVSGYSETEAVRRVAPNVPLLAKPFRADALEKAVRGALAGAGVNTQSAFARCRGDGAFDCDARPDPGSRRPRLRLRSSCRPRRRRAQSSSATGC